MPRKGGYETELEAVGCLEGLGSDDQSSGEDGGECREQAWNLFYFVIDKKIIGKVMGSPL